VENPAERSPPRLVRTAFSRVSLSRCIPTAVVVGTVLSLINQASVIFGGHATGATWVRVGMNFLIPFLVSSFGFYSSQRMMWRSANAAAPTRPA
jgi:hypothetical protein